MILMITKLKIIRGLKGTHGTAGLWPVSTHTNTYILLNSLKTRMNRYIYIS